MMTSLEHAESSVEASSEQEMDSTGQPKSSEKELNVARDEHVAGEQPATLDPGKSKTEGLDDVTIIQSLNMVEEAPGVVGKEDAKLIDEGGCNQDVIDDDDGKRPSNGNDEIGTHLTESEAPGITTTKVSPEDSDEQQGDQGEVMNEVVLERPAEMSSAVMKETENIGGANNQYISGDNVGRNLEETGINDEIQGEPLGLEMTKSLQEDQPDDDAVVRDQIHGDLEMPNFVTEDREVSDVCDDDVEILSEVGEKGTTDEIDGDLNTPKSPQQDKPTDEVCGDDDVGRAKEAGEMSSTEMEQMKPDESSKLLATISDKTEECEHTPIEEHNTEDNKSPDVNEIIDKGEILAEEDEEEPMEIEETTNLSDVLDKPEDAVEEMETSLENVLAKVGNNKEEVKMDNMEAEADKVRSPVHVSEYNKVSDMDVETSRVSKEVEIDEETSQQDNLSKSPVLLITEDILQDTSSKSSVPSTTDDVLSINDNSSKSPFPLGGDDSPQDTSSKSPISSDLAGDGKTKAGSAEKRGKGSSKGFSLVNIVSRLKIQVESKQEVC